MKQTSVLHAPSDVGNQSWGVSLGERQLGYDSRVLVYVQHNPGYRSDINLHFEKRSRLGKLAASSAFFLRSVKREDIYHFYFATSFFPGYPDLRILKILGKKLFFTFQGCDIRPSSACPAATIDPLRHRHEDLVPQQKRLAFLLRMADGTFVLNPDLLDQSPNSTFLPYAIPVSEWQPRFPRHATDRDITIFHSPSDRLVKGSVHVEKAIHALKRMGYRVRLDMVTGAPHNEVLERIAKADIAIDQLLGGWYGAAAVEMMAHGKPTLCFLREDWLPRVPFANEIPLLNASPTTLVSVLKQLLDHPETWESIGKRGRAFVERIHSPHAVAAITTAAYKKSFDKIK